MTQVVLEGIIKEEGNFDPEKQWTRKIYVEGDDGKSYVFPSRGTDEDGYPQVFVNAREVGGSGSMGGQSIKPYLGMKVKFVSTVETGNGFNYEIISENKAEKEEKSK